MGRMMAMRPSLYIKEPPPFHTYCPACGSRYGILVRFQEETMFRCAVCCVAITQNVRGSGVAPPALVPRVEWPEWLKIQVAVKLEEIPEKE